MCPSYMVTREEIHSPRGRANALRLAMSGRLDEEQLTDDDVREALDLCLECRACKAECPVSVDVARFKSEFLAGYWKKNGVPWRARAVGGIHELSKWGSRLAPFSNLVVQSAPARRIGEWLFEIDRRRRLPSWTRRTLAQRMASRSNGNGTERTRSVVLFNDTFTNYCHPEVGVAAADVLAACGIEARLVPHQCCGRPLISQGLLERARTLAVANADALYTAAAANRIVFLEPSCLSAVREDAPALLRGESRRKALAVADACVLFEDYLEREWDAGSIELSLRTGPSTILFHGHCHQKSMGLHLSARTLLNRIPGSVVVDLDAGCCGMAGSFGYARGHYDVSRQIGERRLLPAARAMGPDDVLVASGVSCRQQVSHFTSARAVHAAVLLQSLVVAAGSA